MYRLEIADRKNGAYEYLPIWRNFKEAVELEESKLPYKDRLWVRTNMLNEYGAGLVPDKFGAVGLEFANDKDATLFLLRWS